MNALERIDNDTILRILLIVGALVLFTSRFWSGSVPARNLLGIALAWLAVIAAGWAMVSLVRS
jgi:hypothetical protein